MGRSYVTDCPPVSRPTTRGGVTGLTENRVDSARQQFPTRCLASATTPREKEHKTAPPCGANRCHGLCSTLRLLSPRRLQTDRRSHSLEVTNQAGRYRRDRTADDASCDRVRALVTVRVRVSPAGHWLVRTCALIGSSAKMAYGFWGSGGHGDNIS
ncbi:unnamed protein product, partial [Protopolystoma xenopodis]